MELNVRTLERTIWAFATVAVEAPPLYSAVVLTASGFSSSQLARVAWAFEVFEWSTGPLLQSIGSVRSQNSSRLVELNGRLLKAVSSIDFKRTVKADIVCEFWQDSSALPYWGERVIELQHTADRGYFWETLCDLHAGEVLLAVPWRLAIWVPASITTSDLSLSARLAIAFLDVLQGKPNDPRTLFWQTYANAILPPHVDAVTFWPTEAVEALQWPFAVQAAARHRWHFQRCANAVVGNPSINEGQISASQFEWAWAVVGSRSFEVRLPDPIGGHGCALVPIVDLFNHKPVGFDEEPEEVAPAAWRIEENDDGEFWFMLAAPLALKAGEEAWVPYGHGTNLRLLLDYGFLVPQNPAESIPLFNDFEALMTELERKGIRHPKEGLKQRIALLQYLEELQNETLLVRPGQQGFRTLVVTIGALCALDDEEVRLVCRAFSKDVRAKSLIIGDTPQLCNRALELVAVLCEEMVQTAPTMVEEDSLLLCALPADDCQSEVRAHHLAIMYRLEVKQLLLQTARRARDMLCGTSQRPLDASDTYSTIQLGSSSSCIEGQLS